MVARYLTFHGLIPQGQQVSARIGTVLDVKLCWRMDSSAGRPYQSDHSARRWYPRQLAATIPAVLMPSCLETVGVDRTTTTLHYLSKTG